MNFFTECNRLSIASNKENDAKLPGQNPSFPSVKTSPIVSAPATKVVPKRKKRQNWSKEEDGVLVELMGKGSDVLELKWPHIAAEINQIFGSDRTGKQCRERWLNHLRPDIKKGNWTVDEEFMIEYFYKTFGPKWSTMAKLMKNRTDNDIKNKWNSMKRSEKAGRKRKNAYAHSASFQLAGVVEDRRTYQDGSFQWNAMEQIVAPAQDKSDDIQLFTTGKSSNLKYSTETVILPTVTDGGSAESSPVPQKKYWNYEV